MKKTCESHRVKGWFYLPNVPTCRVPGILTWSQEKGAELELTGGLTPEPGFERTGEATWQIGQFVGDMRRSTIYGESASGEKISLWGAERGDYKADMAGKLQEEFWHASWVCLGSHVPSANMRALSSFTVAFDNLCYLVGDNRFGLPRWTQIQGVECPGEEQEDGTLLLPYVLPVVGGHRSGRAIGATENTTYEIDTYTTSPWVSPATEADPALKLHLMTNRRRRGPSIELSTYASARIAAADGSQRSAEELLESMEPLLDLMSLATFDTPGLEWMTAKTNGREVSLLCHLGYRAMPDMPAEDGGFVFTLNDVSLDDFMKTRQRLRETPQARYAWNVTVGTIGYSPSIAETHISQVIAAADGFYRWCLGVGASNLEQLLKALHGKLSDGIKQRLQLNVDRWAYWAAWSRNHADHGGAKKHHDIGDFYQFRVIADSVRVVTYLVTLREFGIPDEKLLEALCSHQRLQILAGRCSETQALPVTPNTR